MSESIPSEPRLDVTLLTCGQGFPRGYAPGLRLGLIGLALREGGADARVRIIGGSPVPDTAPRGEWRGLPFRYVPGSTAWSRWRSVRRVRNALGLALAWAELRRREAARTVVIALELPASALSWLTRSGATVAIDVSEWYSHGRSERELGSMLKWLQGVIAISRGIEDRVRRLAEARGRPDLRVVRVPVLADVDGDQPPPVPLWPSPYALWIGNPAGEIEDHIRFIVRATQAARKKVRDLRLVLAGQLRGSFRDEIRQMVAAGGGVTDWLVEAGFVPREKLGGAMAAAAALLAPLPSGVRWECCYPTKLADYFLSGGPVLASAVGEVAAELQDGVQALLARPDDVADFADRLARLASDGDLRARIGAAGRAWAATHYDYRVHAGRIVQFVAEVAEGAAVRRRRGWARLNRSEFD